MEKEALEQALTAVEDMLARSRAAWGKFAPGTAQHTLQKNRIAALETAHRLLEAAGTGLPPLLEPEALREAEKPLLSLQSKSTKAAEKCREGSWQRKMMERNLAALALVLPLLEQAKAAGLTMTCLSHQPQRVAEAARWFSSKWKVPLAAYEESMAAGLAGGPVPRWYLVCHGEKIVGGVGVIENDFHDRPDLAPNVCAVYVEEPWRGRGIAGAMLDRVCRDMAALGVETLYLITDHVSFYERYGWEFLCMVQGDGEEQPTRMYRHGPGG